MNRKEKRAQVSNFKRDSGDFMKVVNLCDDLKKKVLAQHEIIQTLLAMVRSLDAKAMATKELCVAAKVFDHESFEDATDREIGLKRRGASDLIQKDDVVYVDFVARHENGDVIASDKNLPLKAGAGAVVFDEFLIGKGCAEKGLCYTDVIDEANPDRSVAGKKIVFEIDVLKVKGNDDGRGSNQAGDAGEGKSSVVPVGHGHQSGFGSLGEYI